MLSEFIYLFYIRILKKMLMILVFKTEQWELKIIINHLLLQFINILRNKFLYEICWIWFIIITLTVTVSNGLYNYGNSCSYVDLHPRTKPIVTRTFISPSDMDPGTVLVND